MNKIFIFFAGVFLVSGLMLPSQSDAAGVDYGLYAKILSQYVDEQGLVDYQGLKENRTEFDQLIRQFETADINVMTPIEQKTFWINAYNAITLKVVLGKYPVKGIRTINFGLVWEVKRDVANQKLSLGHIEHKILRPLGDPRIHFAINCASIGCPKLPNKPFLTETLEDQLEFETIRFIRDKEKVYLDKSKNILFHSAIFSWFEEDFLVEQDSLFSYIKQYLSEEDQVYLKGNPVTLKKLKYDWGLNKQN